MIEDILKELLELEWNPRAKRTEIAGIIKEYANRIRAVQDLTDDRESKKQDVEVEQETKVKLLASINSFLAEQGIKDTDGTPLTFSPERF